MNSIETVGHSLKPPHLEWPALSAEVEEYLAALKATLDPKQAYEIVHPEGHHYGHSGLHPELPALAFDGAILALAWILEAANIQLATECQKFKLRAVTDQMGLITSRFVVGADGLIREIDVSPEQTPSAANSSS